MTAIRYWVFDEAMLASALAEREAERTLEGASAQQAADETEIVMRFLASHAARRLRGDYVKGESDGR